MCNFRMSRRVGFLLVIVVFSLVLSGMDVANATRPALNEPSTQSAYSTVQHGLIAFDTAAGIYTVNPDGSGLRLIVAQPGARRPRWSPDGALLSFNDNGDSRSSELGSIYVVNPDGSGQRLLARGENADWSVDGRELVYNSSRYPVVTSAINLDTGQVRELNVAAPGYPSVSPEGSRLATWVDQNLNSLAVVAIDGSARTTLTVDAYYNSPVHWSPDGRLIHTCFGADGGSDLCLTDPETLGQQNLTGPFRHPAGSAYHDLEGSFSPTGDRIAVTSFQGLYVASVGGSDARLVYGDPTRGLSGSNIPNSPSWQPVGGRPVAPLLRLQGPNRIATAVRVSNSLFTDGVAGAAVLARADIPADALAGTPLALRANGPILLTSPDRLSEATVAELQRILQQGKPVYLLGGREALSAELEDEVWALGFDPVRIFGATRFDTAVQIARVIGDPQRIFLADGTGFAEALIAGATAAATNGVILLTDGARLPDATGEYIDDRASLETVAVGAAVAEAVPSARAIVGSDVYATATLLAQEFFPETTGAAVASGEAFPDGLAGGAHAARAGIPLLLSSPNSVVPELAGYLSGVANIRTLTIYGGRAAISESVGVALHSRVGH